MNPVESLLTGIAPQHLPALVAGLLAALWLATRTAPAGSTLVQRWAATLLGVSAAVHLALPLHPHHGPLVAAGFVASGAGFAVLAHRAHHGRSWRLAAALLVIATLGGYLAALGAGEEPDQVGIATALVELATLGLAAVPGAQPVRPRRVARVAAAAGTVFAVFLVGAVIWVAAFQAHDASAAPVTAAADESAEHDHHDHAGRAQAGMLMRPLGQSHHPTEAQQRAAAELAAQTRQATARYTDLRAALADGYRTSLSKTGTDVHLENKANGKDGAVLDPQRPEMLVYAVEGGRATLLGVVYVMERAGRAGPQPGGPITRWHAHNLCATALPPGLGIVSPYGGCPALSVSVASPEMMHVWTVDNPGGAFAESLDESWVRELNARSGLPYEQP